MLVELEEFMIQTILVKLEQPKHDFNISHGIEWIQELIVLVELEEPKTHLFW